MSSRALPQFELFTPQSIDEAVGMLVQFRDQVSVLAGGTDLLIWKYIRKNHTPYVLSLSAINDMDYLDYIPGEGLRIGARAKVAQLLDHPEVTAKFPALHEAAKTFATPQIRNMATVMGNILRGSPAGDCSCAMLALGGQVILRGPEGQRAVDIDDFWISYGVTARRSDELAVELRIPDQTASSRSAFLRLTRVNEDLAKINVAVGLEMQGDTVLQARIAMGCVGPTLLRLRKAEQLLKGARISATLLEQVAAAAQEEVAPIDDQRSTAEYRNAVSGVILRRVIERAAASGVG
jgi:CO/xanthine dehydrogenase FAD-binding subunit